jgi:hypothetical protein
MVPSLSNAILGAAMMIAVLVVAWIFLPAGWTAALGVLALAGLAVSGAVQAALGHRRRCWVERTLRWWLGPLGAFLDPVDLG